MMKNVVDVVLGGVSYWAIGYGLSYGSDTVSIFIITNILIFEKNCFGHCGSFREDLLHFRRGKLCYNLEDFLSFGLGRRTQIVLFLIETLESEKKIVTEELPIFLS